MSACALALALGAGSVACKSNRAPEKSGSVAKQEQKEQEIPALTIDEVSGLIEKNAISVFDNNSQERYQRGHVPTAKWVAFNDVKASDLPADKDRQLVFYCSNEH